MADRELQTILNSGEITSIKLGGTGTDDAVPTLATLIATNIDYDNSATSLIATQLQAAIDELANVGYGHMILATPYTGGQTIGTTPVKLSCFDTIHHDVNGALTMVVDTSEAIPAHKFTTDKTGTYEIKGNITAEFSSSSALTLQLYKNGVSIASASVELQGRGAGKPVVFSYLDVIDATATDYFEIYAFADSSTSVLITGSSVIMERKAI